MREKFSKNMHWVLWGICVVFYAFQYGIRSVIPSVLNEDLRQYFSINSTDMGSLIGLFYISYMLMQIPVGLLIDRFSAKKICLAAFSLVSLFTVLFVYKNSYMLAAFSRLMLGCCCSFAFVLVIKISNDYFSREKVALVSSIAVSVGSFGPIIMNPLLSHLSGIYPWRSVVFGIGFFGFAMSVLGMFAVCEEKLPEVVQDNDEHLDFSKEEPTGEWKKVWHDLKVVLSNPQYIWVGIFSMMILGPMGAFCDAWGLSFLKESYNLDKEQASFLIANMYFAEIFAAPFAATLAEKLQSYKKVMIGGSILLILLFSCVIFVKMPIYLLTAVLFLIGICAVCQFLSFPMALVSAPKKIGATVTGVVNMITMCGMSVLVPLVGKIMDFSKSCREASAIGEQVKDYIEQDYRLGLCTILISLGIALCTTALMKDVYKNTSSEK